jgi:hypothetical protein
MIILFFLFPVVSFFIAWLLYGSINEQLKDDYDKEYYLNEYSGKMINDLTKYQVTKYLLKGETLINCGMIILFASFVTVVVFVGIDDLFAFFNGYSGMQMSIEVAIVIIFFYTCVAITCTYVLALNHFNEIKDAIKEAKRNERV